MDKYEYKLKLEQLKNLVEDKDYKTAAEIADSINWRKVKSAATLCMVGEIYDRTKRYEDSREILLMAYDRAAVGRNILYRLTLVSLKMGDLEEAKGHYEDFLDVAPYDNRKYILRYQIAKLSGADQHELIDILEEFKSRELIEEWAFELAYLYHRVGDSQRCVSVCDELVLWFGDGRYVEKALEMKMLHEPLDPEQEEMYRQFKQYGDDTEEVHPSDMLESREIIREDVKIPDIASDAARFNTSNLQAEIVKSMNQIINASTKETVNKTMNSIKKMVEDIPLLKVPQEEADAAAEMPYDHIETDEEIDSSLKSEMEQLLAEEWDGQVRMSVQGGKLREPQVNGQMKIQDVIQDWERTRTAAQKVMDTAQERRLESAKARALQEAQDLMERLNDIIPKLEAGISPQELLEERYLQSLPQQRQAYGSPVPQPNWNPQMPAEQTDWEAETSEQQPNWEAGMQEEQPGWGEETTATQRNWNSGMPEEQQSWEEATVTQQPGWNQGMREGQQDWEEATVPQQSGWNQGMREGQQDWEEETTATQRNWNSGMPEEQQGWEEATVTQQPGWNRGMQEGQQDWGGETTATQQNWNSGMQVGQAGWEAETSEQQPNWETGMQEGQQDWEEETTATQRDWNPGMQEEQPGWGQKIPEQSSGWNAEVSEGQSGWGGDISEQPSGWNQEMSGQQPGWGQENQQSNCNPQMQQQPGWGQEVAGRPSGRISGASNYQQNWGQGVQTPQQSRNAEMSVQQPGWGQRIPMQRPGWGQGMPIQQPNWTPGMATQQPGWTPEMPTQQPGWNQGMPMQQPGWGQGVPTQQQPGWGQQSLSSSGWEGNFQDLPPGWGQEVYDIPPGWGGERRQTDEMNMPERQGDAQNAEISGKGTLTGNLPVSKTAGVRRTTRQGGVPTSENVLVSQNISMPEQGQPFENVSELQKPRNFESMPQVPHPGGDILASEESHSFGTMPITEAHNSIENSRILEQFPDAGRTPISQETYAARDNQILEEPQDTRTIPPLESQVPASKNDVLKNAYAMGTIPGELHFSENNPVSEDIHMPEASPMPEDAYPTEEMLVSGEIPLQEEMYVQQENPIPDNEQILEEEQIPQESMEQISSWEETSKILGEPIPPEYLAELKQEIKRRVDNLPQEEAEPVSHEESNQEQQPMESKASLETLIEQEAVRETEEQEEKDAGRYLQSVFQAARESREEKEVIPKIKIQEPEGQIRKLNQEQKEIFSYFVPISGMEQQLCQALEGVLHRKARAKTSSSGNILITGAKGSGKTVLATDFIKAIQKSGAHPNGKVGKINGSALNQKDLGKLIKKIAGGYLIIEKAGDVSRETAIRLSCLMDQDTDGLLVIMEDTRKGIEKVLGQDANFAQKFTERIKIPIFTSDELVQFARTYALEQECEIDDVGVLALYNRISNIQKLDEATTLTEVKEIIDEAIRRAERGGLKKLFGGKKFSPQGNLYLREKDFED